MPPGSAKNTMTFTQQTKLLRERMEADGVSQADLARMVGRTAKHINQVLNGKAGTTELDYWAWCLGLEYHVSIRERNGK